MKFLSDIQIHVSACSLFALCSCSCPVPKFMRQCKCFASNHSARVNKQGGSGWYFFLWFSSRTKHKGKFFLQTKGCYSDLIHRDGLNHYVFPPSQGRGNVTTQSESGVITFLVQGQTSFVKKMHKEKRLSSLTFILTHPPCQTVMVCGWTIFADPTTSGRLILFDRRFGQNRHIDSRIMKPHDWTTYIYWSAHQLAGTLVSFLSNVYSPFSMIPKPHPLLPTQGYSLLFSHSLS